MIQLFFLGSSSVYGVGSERGGWADLVKLALHKKMYAQGGVGQKYEIYNLGKSGATIDYVLNEFPNQLKQFGRGQQVITIVNVGGNNSKAENDPDNFVSTPEEFTAEVSHLLDSLKKQSTHVIAVGSGYLDEAKTYPISNPLTGGKAYFSNKRRAIFQECFKKSCEEKEIPFVEVGVSEEEWKEKYLFEDGLHPNQQGHELIAKNVLAELSKML